MKKINFNLRNFNLLVFFIIVLFIGITFYRLPKTFFQQDEWGAFGIMEIFRQNIGLGINVLFPKTLLAHFAPISFLLEYLQYQLFNLNFAPYAFVSLTFHFLNSLLVYYLFKLLSKKRILSLIAALIFITNSLSHQATTWISTSTSTQGAVLFALISLILFFYYIRKEKRTLFLILSLFSFLVSLGFKENSTFLFFFLPIFWFLFSLKRDLSQFKKLFFPLLLFLGFYFILRLTIVVHPTVTDVVEQKDFIQTTVSNYLVRASIAPFRVISQSIFTTGFILNLAKKFVFLTYPQFITLDNIADPYISESIAFDFVSFILTFLILGVGFLMIKYFNQLKEKKLSKLVWFSLLFIITSALPFIFIPGKAGYASIFEPRNLYFPTIGSSLFLTLIIFMVGEWFVRRKILQRTFFVVMILFSLIIYLHVRNIWRDIGILEERGSSRKEILTKISFLYPVLPKKVIFYAESNSSYYGLPDEEKILPFQSGFGQTLLVWYQNHDERFPSCLFVNQWLYEIDSQGYKFCGGRGFGYFRKFEDLKEAFRINNLKAEDVIAFSWQKQEKSLKDITFQVRERLSKLNL